MQILINPGIHLQAIGEGGQLHLVILRQHVPGIHQQQPPVLRRLGIGLYVGLRFLPSSVLLGRSSLRSDNFLRGSLFQSSFPSRCGSVRGICFLRSGLCSGQCLFRCGSSHSLCQGPLGRLLYGNGWLNHRRGSSLIGLRTMLRRQSPGGQQ